MNVTIVGTGYVGLVSGTCLAEVGNHVMCVDTDPQKIEGLQRGKVPIYEPGLDAMVHENSQGGRLNFTTSIEEGVAFGEIVFIAVGTPPDEDGSADLKYVLQVAESVGKHMETYRVVVTKSTVPVGTAAKVKARIEGQLQKRGVEIPFSVASNPEFLKEGAAIDDFMKPDRIVVGTEDDRALDKLRQLYAPFNRNHERLIAMDIPSAELTKYAANAMLATKISFMNEIANLSTLLGADVEAVRKGIGSDPRIGYQFIYPGCGYGGSCFPKDVQALHRTAREVGYDARILDAVEAVNYDQKLKPLESLLGHVGDNLQGKRFALWGLAFKPDTDDMREAPSRVLIEGLWQHGAAVNAFDPVACEEARRIYGERPDLALFEEDPYQALEGVDGLLVVTEWKIFRSPDLAQMKARMNGKLVVDGRNIFDPRTMREAGFVYYGIGRPNA